MASETTSRAAPGARLFTLRCWREDLGGGASEWRMRLQSAHDPADTRYFRDVATLSRMLQEQLITWDRQDQSPDQPGAGQ